MALVAAPAGEFGDTSDIGRRVGMLFTICSVGSLIGPPISGAIHDKYGGFEQMSIYAGKTVSYAFKPSIGFMSVYYFLALSRFRDIIRQCSYGCFTTDRAGSPLG